MSLLCVSRSASANQCFKACSILDKSYCPKICECQKVRVLVTCQSANTRRLSYTLKTTDEKRAILPPVSSNAPPKRHQSITLNGLSTSEEDSNILSKHPIKSWTSSIENIKEKISQLFPTTQKKNSAAFESSTKPYNSIPGPKGLPGFGSALDYTKIGKFSPQEFHIALRDRHNKYGPIFREKIMNEEFVYVSDPNDIRMLAQNEGSAPCRPSLEVMVESRKQEGLPVGITAMQGSEWLKNRIAINPVISLSKTVTKFRDPQREVTQDFVKLMKTIQCKETFEVPNFEELVLRWALESIAVVLLNSRLGLLESGSSNKDSAAEGLRKCMDVFFDYGARLTFGLPMWKLCNTTDWKIFRKAQTDEFRFAGYFVEKKHKELQQEKKQNDPLPNSIPSGCPMHKAKKSNPAKDASCLLDHVINNSKLSKDDAITVCLEMLAGGIDTTSTAVVFTLYQLARNPEHQKLLREFLQEESNQSTHEYNRETSKFSKYIKACVWESLRLNPLTYANARRAQKDLVLSGYSVPAGTHVRFTSHLMNLENEEYFLEPKKFVPARWMDKDSPYRCKKQFTFTPFGHGPRQCPGRRVAEQELDLFFRQILSIFQVGYKHEDIGIKVRLFNAADKPAKFEFKPLKQNEEAA